MAPPRKSQSNCKPALGKNRDNPGVMSVLRLFPCNTGRKGCRRGRRPDRAQGEPQKAGAGGDAGATLCMYRGERGCFPRKRATRQDGAACGGQERASGTDISLFSAARARGRKRHPVYSAPGAAEGAMSGIPAGYRGWTAAAFGCARRLSNLRHLRGSGNFRPAQWRPPGNHNRTVSPPSAKTEIILACCPSSASSPATRAERAAGAEGGQIGHRGSPKKRAQAGTPAPLSVCTGGKGLLSAQKSNTTGWSRLRRPRTRQRNGHKPLSPAARARSTKQEIM